MMVADHPPQTPAPPIPMRANSARPEPARRFQSRTWSALRALFWVDFRPLLPLALFLLLAAFFVAGILSWNGGPNRHLWMGPRESNLLLIRELRVFVAVGCLVGGLLLGIFQARNWVSPQLWAYLKHRPASPGLLFAGRALAGLALYAIAILFPLSLLFALASTQEPFEWHFTVPYLLVALVGLVCSLAGILVVQRDASFFGSRLAPLLGAAALSILIFSLSRASHALLAIAIFLLVYALAVVGAHTSEGFRLRAPRITRLALGTLLFFGYSALLYALSFAGEDGVFTWCRGDWSVRLRNQPVQAVKDAIAAQQARKRPVSYVLLPDGSLARATAHPFPADALQVFREMQGASYSYERVGPPPTPYIPQIETLTDSQGQPYTRFVDPLPVFNPVWVMSHQNSYDTLAAEIVLVQPDGSRWWLVRPAGIYQLFDAHGRYQGSLGASGFVAGGHAASFGTHISTNTLGRTTTFELRSELGIYNIDLVTRTAVPAHPLPNNRRILDYKYFNTPIAFGEDRLYVYASPASPTPTREVLLPYPIKHNQVWIAELPKVRQWALWHGYEIDIYDASWQHVSTIQVPSSTYFIPETPPPEWYLEQQAHSSRDFAWRMGALHALCNPLAVTAVNAYSQHDPYDNPDYNYLSSTPWYHLQFSVAPDALNNPLYFRTVMGILLTTAIAMVLLTRRYSVPLTPLWILAAILTGPVMLLVLLSLYRLPRKIVCHHCRSKHFLYLSRCPRCGTPAPSPAKSDTEIFSTSEAPL